MAKNFKLLKQDLIKWNKVFGKVKESKQLFIKFINKSDQLEENRSLSVEERNYKDSTKAELEKLILDEEISWRQKSKAIWIKEGGRNTKFIHLLANSHRQQGRP